MDVKRNVLFEIAVLVIIRGFELPLWHYFALTSGLTKSTIVSLNGIHH